jgi:uracil-DNA glycosylase
MPLLKSRVADIDWVNEVIPTSGSLLLHYQNFRIHAAEACGSSPRTVAIDASHKGTSTDKREGVSSRSKIAATVVARSNSNGYGIVGTVMRVIWFVCLLAFALSASAQDSCDQVRSKATWRKNTLFALTYKCIPDGWEAFFNDPAVKAEVKKISNELRREIRAGDDVNPAIGDVFRAMYVVPPSHIKAVILGQDPAPTKGQATGLSFSLKSGTPPFRVPSVQRVILEASNEGFSMNLQDGDLSAWSEQGVLMLNTALSIPCVKASTACTIGGHLQLWKAFSKKLIEHVDAQNSPQAFILWGTKAAKFSSSVTNPLHRVFVGGHPSPVSAGEKFFCKSYFTCSNRWLDDHQVSKIDWDVAQGAASQESCVWSKGKTPKCVSVCIQAACN